MEDFEIINSPREKWRRLAFLLDTTRKISEIKHTQYYTFHYDACYTHYEDVYTFEEEINQLKRFLQKGVHLFYENIIETF